MTVHDSNGVLLARCSVPYGFNESVTFTASPSDETTIPPPPVLSPSAGQVSAAGRDTFQIDTGFTTMPQYCANITYHNGQSSGALSDESPVGSNYMPMSRCGWSIQVPEGDVIDLTVTRLDLEDGYDFLEVFDAASSFGDSVKIFRCVLSALSHVVSPS